ncbi:MAG: TonB family protein [Candidatus Sulfotelmatobacter sp.]
MFRFYLVPLLLLPGLLYAQGTISVDAITTMRVCSSETAGSTGPCATAPRPVTRINPTYPEKARQKRKQGTVTLGLTVAKNGSATDVHVVNSVDKDIDQAAIDAVSQWKFEPGTYQGNPVDVELTVQVNFRLSTNPPQNAAPIGTLPGANGNTEDFRNLYSDASEAYSRADYATAINLLRRATSMAPQNPNAWNELGRALMAMNEMNAAANAFEAAIQNDPASRNAYNNLGLVYWRQRKYEEATAQFSKQTIINPQDHYAHRNLGMMLRDQKKCGDAMPELQKALAITPNHPETLLAEGECDLDLGNRAKGISELQQATSASSAPNVFNSAAYALAKRSIELAMAEKWSEACLAIEKTRLQSVSLDHLTPEQLNYVYWTSAYWDTRGWIYFLRGDKVHARSYVTASWSLRQDPTVGDHLGRIYDDQDMKEDAKRTFAMAVASADKPTRANIDPDDVADARRKLEGLAGSQADKEIERAQVALSAMSVLTVPNAGEVGGSGDFNVLLVAEGSPEIRQVSGDTSLAKVAEALRAARFPVHPPESSGVGIPLRGTLTCHSEDPQCRFTWLSPEEAVNVVRTEMAAVSATPAPSMRDPHTYDSPAMGMRISLPDDWKLMREEPGSFSQPRSAMFGKSGTAAMFMLTRERMEGSPELYQKMIEASFSTRQDYKRAGEEAVKRDGLAGTRWNVSWNENGVPYTSVMEIYSVGDDHYRLTTLAPTEVYGRYAETFENIMHSVQFPLLRADPQLLDPTK